MSAHPFRRPADAPPRFEELAESGLTVRDVMRRGVITVGDTDGLALASQVMLSTGVHHVPVLRRGKLVGMLSHRDVLRPRGGDGERRQLDASVAEVMSAPVDEIDPDEGVEQAAATMVAHDVGCLPVVEGGRLVGILTTSDLLGLVAAPQPVAEAGPEPTVGEVMTHGPLTVTPGTGLIEAMSLLVDRGVRHLPVVDAQGRLCGLLSERDFHAAIGLPGRLVFRLPGADLHEARVEDAMTPEPKSVSEKTPLSTAIALLAENRFGALPVIDDERRLVGILSVVDVLREVATGPG